MSDKRVRLALGYEKIALLPLNAGAEPQVRMVDPDPRMKPSLGFEPDGKSLVYAIRANGVENLWLQPLDGSAGRPITNFPEDRDRVVSLVSGREIAGHAVLACGIRRGVAARLKRCDAVMRSAIRTAAQKNSSDGNCRENTQSAPQGDIR